MDKYYSCCYPNYAFYNNFYTRIFYYVKTIALQVQVQAGTSTGITILLDIPLSGVHQEILSENNRRSRGTNRLEAKAEITSSPDNFPLSTKH